MSKILTALMCALLSSTSLAKPLKIVTTFTIFADMAEQVGGEHAQVLSITKAGADIHNYQPTPRDIVKIQGADAILWHGLNLELWFEKFYSKASTIPRYQLTAGIEPLSIAGGAYEGKPNPHAWMSADNALIYLHNITAALSELAPQHRAEFEANAARYGAQISSVMHDLKQQLQAVPPAQRWLVSSEGAFSYLARDLGLEELFIWPINADAQGSPQQMRRVIDLVKQHRIPVVFSESTVSDKPAKQVAREAGSRYGGVLYVDSLSAPDGPVPDYLSLLKVTGETVVSALRAGGQP
ncbi:MAG: metal ABC transporter substrate-binding protein [Pseudomonadales bacterium]